MIDLHSHTTRCHHAFGRPEEYAEAAVAAGLTHFGQSCHSPWMLQEPGRPLAMGEDEVEDYVADVLELRERFRGRVEILLGMEMDWFVEAETKIRATANAYPFDYLIGSVHHVPELPIGYPSVRRVFNHFDDATIWPAYFRAMVAMIRAEVVDIVAHIDLPKLKTELPPEEWIDYATPAIEALAGGRTAVEINTSGRAKRCAQYFPDPLLLRRLREADIPLTIGSDAHHPSQVARYFDHALELVREAGYEELVYFVGREARTLSLEQG